MCELSLRCYLLLPRCFQHLSCQPFVVYVSAYLWLGQCQWLCCPILSNFSSICSSDLIFTYFSIRDSISDAVATISWHCHLTYKLCIRLRLLSGPSNNFII